MCSFIVALCIVLNVKFLIGKVISVKLLIYIEETRFWYWILWCRIFNFGVQRWLKVAWLVGLSDMGYDKGFEGKIWKYAWFCWDFESFKIKWVCGTISYWKYKKTLVRFWFFATPVEHLFDKTIANRYILSILFTGTFEQILYSF